MKFLIMLRNSVDAVPDMEGFQRYFGQLASSGKLAAMERLDSSQHGKVHKGQPVTTDGPFVEAREVLGGYFVLEAESFDEAMEVATACPTAREGTVFVHPILGAPTRGG
ncbi:MAG: YciI family protein [Myxococcota bacterium]